MGWAGMAGMGQAEAGVDWGLCGLNRGGLGWATSGSASSNKVVSC